MAALDQPWLDLGTLARRGVGDADDRGRRGRADDLDYPPARSAASSTSRPFDAVADLIDAGDRLQSMLVDNTEIAGTVTEEALTGLSYFVRYGQVAGRVATGRSRGWSTPGSAASRIDARGGVTLSSANGEFVVTLTNTLDHPVAVSVRAESDDGIEVTEPERVVLPPRAATRSCSRPAPPPTPCTT